VIQAAASPGVSAERLERALDGSLPDVRGRRVVVAMSGGVDSSVAAALLARAGARVVGITMKNFCYSRLSEESAAASCCSLEAIEDARRVADRVGFPHYVLDFEEPFGRAVIDDFVNEYAAGRTPNPCVRCNRLVRFPHLHARALALGADFVATGHYARTLRGADGAPRLLRGADGEKDQAYYLWGITPKLLERTVFPVGGLTKSDVRALAAELELEVASKPESMEVCFIPDGDVRGFLEREVAGRDLPAGALARFRPGPIVSRSGQVLGEHPGSAFFTVGQRRGLGVAAGEPRYVVALREANTIVLGTKDDLFAAGLDLEEINWIAGSPPSGSLDVQVQIRHRQRPAPARVNPVGARSATVELEQPLPAVAPGQSAVLYCGDEVLGGGVIRRAVA
jgi:tRNA-specific 2-thiouridylase